MSQTTQDEVRRAFTEATRVGCCNGANAAIAGRIDACLEIAMINEIRAAMLVAFCAGNNGMGFDALDKALFGVSEPVTCSPKPSL